jgi:hypothetical protein
MGNWFTGESPSLEFEQGPEQKKMFNTMFGPFQSFMQGNFPQMYDLPSPVMPSTDWYNNIAPEVRQSLWEPAQEGGRQMMEAMGAKGQVGSAGSPISGSAQTGMGKLFADYSQGIGSQAWNMMQPGMMADYNAQLGRNIQGDNTSLMPFQAAANMLPGTYSHPVVNPGRAGALGPLLQVFGAAGDPAGLMGGVNSGIGNLFGQQQTPQIGTGEYMGNPADRGYGGYAGGPQGYNQGVGGAGGLMGLMGTIGSFFCDRRLKKNIKPLYEINGIQMYEFEYLWDSVKRIGPMAQDLLKSHPEHVFTVGGYYAVKF